MLTLKLFLVFYRKNKNKIIVIDLNYSYTKVYIFLYLQSFGFTSSLLFFRIISIGIALQQYCYKSTVIFTRNFSFKLSTCARIASSAGRRFVTQLRQAENI